MENIIKPTEKILFVKIVNNSKQTHVNMIHNIILFSYRNKTRSAATYVV